MKKIGKYLLLGTSVLGLAILASCGNDNQNSNVKKIVFDNLEYKEIGENVGYNSNQSAEINPYNYDTFPYLKFINLKDKLDIEIYLGFHNGKNQGIEEDKHNDTLVVDKEQEITCTLYRTIAWEGTPQSKDVKILPAIKTEIYSFKEKLGFFLDGEFNKDARNIKYNDIVTLEELNKNYYDCGDEEVLALGENDEFFYTRNINLGVISYQYTLSCDENDYIRYYKKIEQGIVAESDDGYYNPLVRGNYKNGKVIYLNNSTIVLEKIDGKIAIQTQDKDGVIHYY